VSASLRRAVPTLAAALAVLCMPSRATAQGTDPVVAVGATLDAFHLAAAKSDGAAYFGLFTADGVFIGTDAGERWTVAQFRAYADPFFAAGRGWTYRPRARHVVIADLPCRCVATFDELLDNASYGTTRGTGMLVLQRGSWRIAQYALTIPVPNDMAAGMAALIRAYEHKP
jgi:hypothetical protein